MDVAAQRPELAQVLCGGNQLVAREGVQPLLGQPHRRPGDADGAHRYGHAVLQRGVRGDEAAPGSGFGLAIVRDLAELYGGAIALSASELGGVRAVLTLPAADGASGAQSRSRT